MEEVDKNYLDYATDVRKERRKGKNATNEFFTPPSIVNKMCDKISEEDWANPEKIFLEPSAGNGNFVIEIVKRRINHNVSWQDTLKTLFTVELMPDNVSEMKDRVYNLIKELCPTVNKFEAYKIMNHNFVCSDFFKWDFENWKSIKEPKEAQLTLDF